MNKLEQLKKKIEEAEVANAAYAAACDDCNAANAACDAALDARVAANAACNAAKEAFYQELKTEGASNE